MRAVVIIPALNEAGNMRRLISEVPRQLPGVDSVLAIVVDNGSTDATAAEAEAAGARVISEARRGYGSACAAGAAAAEPTDILVFLDGDGSFDPAEMALLVQPIAEEQADLVVGSRSAHIDPGAMPPHQRFGNQLVSWLMGVLYGLKLTDLGPYRAIRAERLQAMHMQELTYGWTTEMTVKAARQHLRILEVPVHYRKRWSGKSKIGGTVRGTLMAAYFILGVTLRYAFTSTNTASGSPRQ